MKEYSGKPHTDILKAIYEQASELVNKQKLQDIFDLIDDNEKASLQIVVDNCESSKGVLTVLITSLIHKLHNPLQDIHKHQENMAGGYSGRGIDTKYVTPFMKEMGLPSMAESGWLTRSLEQNLPYDLSYPGKIKPPHLKSAFLYLIDQVQTHNKSAHVYLLFLFSKLIEHREHKTVDLTKPINLPITTIIDYLKLHFEAKYSSRGASRLPTLAIYAIYQCMMKELKRFEGKILMPLEEHTSSDKGSGRVADIEVRDSLTENLFEAVEIKHAITIKTQILKDAYEKFKTHPIRRFYLLSTADIHASDVQNLKKEAKKILKIHGCQVIINGIYPTIKYYLRLLHNPDDFIDNYVEGLKTDKAIKYEHKLKWNEIISQQTL